MSAESTDLHVSADFDVTEIRRELGARLRDARFRAGKSQKQAGEYVDLDGSAISRLETGKVEGPDLMVILTLIHRYGASAGRILDELGTKRVFRQGQLQGLEIIAGEGRGRRGEIPGQRDLFLGSVT